MSLLKITIINLFLFNFLTANENQLNTGVFFNDVFVSKKEAKIASKLWNKQMNRLQSDIKINVLLYEDEEKLIKEYSSKDLSVLLVSSHIYFKNKNIIDSLSMKKWCLSRSDEKFTQYYLIKNIDSKKEIKDLSNTQVIYTNQTAKSWVELLSFKETKKIIDVDTSLKKVYKDKQLIFDIFFNKNIFSVVSKDVYNSVMELNPQMKKRIKILRKSEQIFPMIIGFDRKDLDKNSLKTLEKMHFDINDTSVNIDSLSYLSVSKIYDIDKDEMSQLEKFYKEYFDLKNNLNNY